jgi:F-type H+-transporting ATPase subunit a
MGMKVWSFIFHSTFLRGSKFTRKLILFMICLIICQGSFLLAASPSKDGDGKSKGFDAGAVILDHILDSYEWHIADYGDLHISIPLPVILYYEGTWYFFFSSRFHHGYESYKGISDCPGWAKKEK